MLRISALFLAFLAPAATQTSSNLEGRQISITRQTGSSVVITCDIVNQNTNYVHWYRYQEGMAPRRLLYYEFSSSQFVVDQGISSEKYSAYEATGRTCKFVLRNLEESDSGVYYCAVWERHSD